MTLADPDSGVRPCAPLALIFDLDGTLIDSRLDIAAACNHALAKEGRPALPSETIGAYVGDGARSLLARAFDLPLGSPVLDGAIENYVSYYTAHPVEHTTLMPGAREAIRALSDRPLGLVTNKPRAITTRVLEALELTSLFAVVIAGEEQPLKPDPAPILAAAKAMGVKPADTWVIGDGTQDMAAGRAAGCLTVAVLGGFHEEAPLRAIAPDVILRSLDQLAPLVRASGAH
jgi:phosphoglycolate phosphatase